MKGRKMFQKNARLIKRPPKPSLANKGFGYFTMSCRDDLEKALAEAMP